MSDDYLWDGSGPADPEIARLEVLLAPLAHTEVKRRRRWWLPALALVAAAAVIAVLAWPRASRCDGSGFRFTGVGGTVACGGTELASGTLPVGATLETHATTATLAIAAIGTAQLGAHTRVRLDQTGADRHQLYLEQGTLHAKVSAPPRLFAVATPSTAVIDLGCEYAITMDPHGAGSIHVLGGKVELDMQGGIVVAPAGTHAAIHPGRRPGYPIVDGADPAFETAVIGYEQGVSGALDRMLAAATPRDAITLINLVILEPGRVEVLRRLGEVTTVPDGITVDKAVADPAARAAWRESVVAAQIALDGILDR